MAAREAWVDGLDRLYVNMDRCIEEVGAAAKDGLKRAGMQIIASAQRNMRTAGHNGASLNNEGHLSNSGKVQDVPDSNDVEIGFFDDRTPTGYAAYVEYGTRPHWTSVSNLLDWARRKLVRGGKSRSVRGEQGLALSAAYAVQRSIAKRGARPHPFFGPAVKKHQRDISKAISEAVRKVTAKDMR